MRGSSSSSSESSSSSDDPGDRDGGSWVESREKSSMDAGSEGEGMVSGDGCSACRVEGVASVAAASWPLGLSSERRVGRFGVDLDWKPCGTGGGLGGIGAPLPPLL